MTFFAENPLGLNLREARLADRVRGMQDENQVWQFCGISKVVGGMKSQGTTRGINNLNSWDKLNVHLDKLLGYPVSRHS